MWGKGSLVDLPGRSYGLVTLGGWPEHLLRERLPSSPWPFLKHCSKGSGNAPGVGLFGSLAVCQPGPARSRLLNKQKVWWFSLLSSHLSIHFWLGNKILSTFGVKRLSWGCANYQTWSLWALSGSINPMSLISANHLDSRRSFLLIPSLPSTFVLPVLHPTAFRSLWWQEPVPPCSRTPCWACCVPVRTRPEPGSTPSGQVGRSHWP